MKDILPKLLFVTALMGMAFAYGFISHWKEIFPYQLLHEGYLAFEALSELDDEDLQLTNVAFWDESGVTAPTYRKVAATAGNEHIFLLGNDRTYRSGVEGDAFLAWIADREGNIVHAWKDPGDIWSPLIDRDAVGDAWEAYPIGALLLPNGDILVSYQAYNLFPISMGIAKFDKDSNLLWKNNGYFHHWFTVGPSGEIYIPHTIVGESPMAIPDHQKRIHCADTRFPYDSVVILDKDGEKIDEIDLLSAFVESDLTGVFNSNTADHETIQTCDPMHLNDVRVLPESLETEFERFAPGDLLLSFRSLNGVGVLDPRTRLFKWFYVGASHHQHSPRYFTDNRILMFDNYGGRTSRGMSRLLSVDVASGKPMTLFPRSGAELPADTFFSKSGGHIDVNSSGQRVLLTFSLQGLVWEVDTKTGEVLWEYVNTHTVDDRPARIDLYVANYVGEFDFPLNHGRLNAD